ncbi:MAG: hypothetical protein WBA16_00320 [Nonlabens sp.]
MKKILGLLVLVITAASCSESVDQRFVWGNDQVGLINKETKIFELDSLFKNDSIINPIKGDEFGNGPNTIDIYEKGGKHLLSLTPKEALDSTSTIDYVLIKDDRYLTDKGIGLNSTFKQIAGAYEVSSVDNIIDDAMIRLKNQNFYFTISKETFPDEVRFDMEKAIELTMIPEEVTPEAIFVRW